MSLNLQNLPELAFQHTSTPRVLIRVFSRLYLHKHTSEPIPRLDGHAHPNLSVIAASKLDQMRQHTGLKIDSSSSSPQLLYPLWWVGVIVAIP